jgi:TonB family protein
MKKTILLSFFLFVFNAINAQEITTENKTKKDSTIITRAEVMPSFPGGSSELMKFLSKNINYPVEARKIGAEGKVVVNFYVDTDGSIKNPIIVKDPVGYGCAEEVLRVISIMPKWAPGMQDGVPAKVYFTLPVTFKLSNDNTSTTSTPASFIGGDVELEKYKTLIVSQIKKSKKDKKKIFDISINFVILETGKVKYATIAESNTDDTTILDYLLDSVNNMPNWSPEVKNGKTITTFQNINFKF